MINCTIKTNEKSLNVELPMDIYLLNRQAHEQLGVNKWIGYIKLGDKKDDAPSFELTSTDEVGKYLIPLFSNQDSIEDINAAVNVVVNASEHIKEELRQKIIAGEYEYTNQMYRDIKEIIYTAAPIQETFYFPLIGNIFETDCCEPSETDNDTLLRNEYQIREALETYWDSNTEHMAEYYDKIGHEKVLSVIWDIECIDNKLYGKVEARFTEPLTDKETEALKDWISGQNSDGLGEGFEQQEINTDDGTLTVSMWHPNDDYFIYNQEEMDAYIAEQSNGGITMK